MLSRLRALLSLLLFAVLLVPEASCASTPATGAVISVATSPIGAIAANRRRSASPPVTSSAVSYDTSIGLGVDANGFADLTLRSGAKNFFVNSSTGNDANTCTQAQAAATPKATYSSAASCLTSGEGDHVLMAEGTSYAVAPTGVASGFSAQYPTVIESYDPADPTNAAKYGRASGSNRPVVYTGGSPTEVHFVQGTPSPKYVALRGLDFNPGSGVVSAEYKVVGSSNDQTPDYFLFENDLFRYTQFSFDNGSAPAKARKLIIRNSAFYRSWGDHSQGIYLSGVDGTTIEDNVFWQNGWLGVNRDAAVTSGGASFFNHAIYAQTNNINTIARRNVTVDSSLEGANLKGGGILRKNLSIRNANSLAEGSGDVNSIDAPFGVYADAGYNAAVGGNIVNTATGCKYCGASSVAFRQNFGLIHDNVMANSGNQAASQYALTATTQTDVNGDNITVPNYVTFNHNVSYLWASSGKTTAFNPGNPLVHATATNNIWDDPASGSNVNVGSVTFPNAYTESSLLSALGYADEATAVADWTAHPEQHKWEQGVNLMLAGYGITRTQVDLAADLRFTAGVAQSGQFIGTLDGFTLSWTGAPSCASIDDSSKAWRTDTTCTPGSGTAAITETDGTNSHTTFLPWTIYPQPILSSITVTPGSTTATINFSASVSGGTLYDMVSTVKKTLDSWGYVRANVTDKLEPGTAGAFHSSQAVTATGAQPAINVTGLTASTAYTAYLVQVDANNNVSPITTVDFTTGSGTGAATLSSPTGTSTGLTTANIGVTTDTGSGTLYEIVAANVTGITAAQVEAGQDAAGAAATWTGNQAVTTTGVKSASVTGLTTGTTYYACFAQHTTLDSTPVCSAGFAPSLALVSTLNDNFNDGSMDATKWTQGQLDSQTGSTTGVTVAETGGQLQVTGPALASTSRNSGYLSVNQYKLQGDSFFVEIPNVASQTGSTNLFIIYGASAANCYKVDIASGTSLKLNKVVGGTQTLLASVAVGSNVWFRVRESAGKIWVDGAPATAGNPPLSTDWVNLTSGSEDAGLSVTAGYINIGAGTWTNGTTATMQFDGFNTGT